MTNVLIAFALKEEFAPWRRRHAFRAVPGSPARVAHFGSTDVYAALIGAGAVDAHWLAGLIEQVEPKFALVTGVAAGLKPQWWPGDVLVAQTVCGPDGKESIAGDAELIHRALECGAKPAPVLITLPRIARTAEEKRSLASLGDAADMESLVVMKEWSELGIPALALRVILDPVEMPMTIDFEAAMDAHGQVRVTRVLAQLLRRPQLLPDLLRLARQNHRSTALLARFLDRFFQRASPYSRQLAR
jgi:adenosylhomocysteine nucleosidase